jgi:hypothetical protein
MTEEQGMTLPAYDNNGRQEIALRGPVEDEAGRVMVRAESRDEHDTTYFTLAGDVWNTETAYALGTGDASTVKFYFGGQATDLDYPDFTQTEQGLHKEVKDVTIYFDGVEVDSADYTVDVTVSADQNKTDHFARGFVTFNTAPGSGVAITADYKWLGIGDGAAELVYDQSNDGVSKTIDITFADPTHIKDGVIYFMNGALDAKVNVYALCPVNGVYKDDNKNLLVAQAEHIVGHYVVNHRLMGDSPMGHYFDVEARSGAMPAGYIVRCIIDAGSATNLKAVFRLEINRQRTHVI